MALVTTINPTETAVTLAEAKEQVRVTDAIHDTRLLRLIDAATSSIETYLNTRLVEQTVRLDMTGFRDSQIDLGLYPVQSITSIAYDDEDDVEQTLVEGTDFWASLNGMYPYIKQIDGWPTVKPYKPDSVRVTMVVGYSDVTEIPKDIRHAILIRVKEYFDHAGESVIGQTLTPAINTVRALTDQHRRITL